MNSNAREAGRRLLANYYSRQRGLVAFIDESTRGLERDNEFPFYILSAVVFGSDQLDKSRQELVSAASGDFWHTTESYKNGDYAGIRTMTDLVAHKSVLSLVAVQVDVPEGNLEFARRESLVQLAFRLSNIGCKLAIYELRNKRALDAGDASLLNLARRDGWLTNGVGFVGSKPSMEPLLWAPDLLSWSFRQVITRGDQSWVGPYLECLEILDVSGMLSENAKRPETAAARNSGPVLPAGQTGDRARRSSLSIMPNYQKKLQEILHMLPIFDPPGLPTEDLRLWIKKTFPK